MLMIVMMTIEDGDDANYDDSGDGGCAADAGDNNDDDNNNDHSDDDGLLCFRESNPNNLYLLLDFFACRADITVVFMKDILSVPVSLFCLRHRMIWKY